jgi:hypothetical protein
MSIKFYVRKLKHQELGYTEGVGGGQRGRYILIAKRLADFFPKFNEELVEPSISISVVSPDNRKLILCEYVWHNGSRHRGKDKRLYLNIDVAPSDDFFRPGDYAVFYKIKDDTDEESYIYKVYKFNPNEPEYQKLENLAAGNSHSVYEDIDFIDVGDVKFSEYVISERTVRRFGGSSIDTEGNCNSENEFRNLIRATYGYKCSISGGYFNISDTRYTNLQAAHIKPDSHDGPLRPDNGILLCLDMHWAFDYGCFTINDNFKIKVHERMKESTLYKYNDKNILLPNNSVFYPNSEYLTYHRENIFGRLRPLRR